MTKKNCKKKLEKQLRVYSAAAAGALALAPAAEAAIHYSGPQNIVVDASNQVQPIDLNSDSVNDFTLSFITSYPEHVIKGVAGNSVIDSTLTYLNFLLAANLPSNYSIRSLLSAGKSWAPGGALDYYYGVGVGNFLGSIGYIGVRFNIPDNLCNPVYGWIQYQANATATTGTILGWAYDDNCRPIAAGQTQSIAIPTLNEWGMIIFTLLLGGLAARKLSKQSQKDN